MNRINILMNDWVRSFDYADWMGREDVFIYLFIYYGRMCPPGCVCVSGRGWVELYSPKNNPPKQPTRASFRPE